MGGWRVGGGGGGSMSFTGSAIAETKKHDGMEVWGICSNLNIPSAICSA